MTFPSYLVPDASWMISSGRLDGFTRAFGIGYNPSIDSGQTGSAFGRAGGIMYPWITNTAGQAMEVVAPGSTQDIGDSGTGAWTVVVSGIEPVTGLTITDTITLNGATPVPLPRPYWRINSFRTTRAGSTRKNSVDIHLRDVGGGATIRGIILAGKSVARQAAFTVPVGFMLLVPQIVFVVDAASGSTARKASFETYFAGPLPAPAILPLPINNSNGRPYNHDVSPPLIAVERTDFDLVISGVSDNSTIITAGWNGILKRNTL